jgi:hypothetical protein
MSLINSALSYFNLSQAKQLPLTVSQADVSSLAQEHYEIAEVNKTLNKLISQFYNDTISFAKEIAEKKSDEPPKKKIKTKRLQNSIRVGTLLNSIKTPKKGRDGPHLGKFSEEMASIFNKFELLLEPIPDSSIEEISIDRDNFKSYMLEIYNQIAINLEIIGSHHMNSSNVTEAKVYYDTAQKFCDVIEETEIKNSISVENPTGSIFLDSALIKLQIEFNQALLNKETLNFEKSKTQLRKVIQRCEDLSNTEPNEEFFIWANQAADVYMQILDQESPSYSDQAKVVRKWMSLERVPESLQDSNLHRVKVLTNLGVLLKKIEDKPRSPQNLSPLELINSLQDYITKKPNEKKNAKGAYNYFEEKGKRLNCTSEIVNKLINQLKYRQSFPQLPLTSKDAVAQAKVLFDLSKFSNIQSLKVSINNNVSNLSNPQNFASLSSLSAVKVRHIHRDFEVNGEQKNLHAVRFYPRSKTSDDVFVRKCSALSNFCSEYSIEIRPKKTHSLLAQIDFSLLADVAYESPDELPAFYNLLLWWFDDKYIDELDAKSDNLELITNYISQMKSILYADTVEFIHSDDTELVKIAKQVKGLLIDRQITPQNSPGFFERTIETFEAQLVQAKRKQDVQILTPKEFYDERLKFSGVWPSLELALALLTKNKQDSKSSVTENSFIKEFWEKVNWLVSIDNCWDSSIKEIFKEKDPENYVFVKYIDALIKKDLGNKKDTIKEYFNDIDYVLLQDIVTEVATEANKVLFEIREMLDCFPEEFTKTDYELALTVGAQWVKALDWSKRTVRYYGDAEASRQEQSLLKKRKLERV